MSLGTVKIINLKNLGGSGEAGHRVQEFTIASGQLTYTVTDWVPDANLIVEIDGVGWDDGWTLEGSNIVFDFQPKVGSTLKAIN